MAPIKLNNPVRLHPNAAWEKMANPRLSVILPCYNYSSYLPEAVASVFDQGVEDVELIIINDGSTDDSLDVALNLASLFENQAVLVIDQENQGQPAISRNNAIHHARGSYILPLDADDVFAENAFIAMLSSMEKSDKKWTIVTASMQRFGTDDDRWTVVPFDSNNMLRRNQIPYCAMYPKALWEKLGGYNTNVPGYEDWDFWIGALTEGAHFLILPMVHLLYRETSVNSMMDRGVSKHEYNIAGIICNHPHAYEDDEVEWALRFRTLFPKHPSKRGFYGLDKEFPRVAALLILFYPKYFPEEQVRWCEQYIQENPLILDRGVKASPRMQPVQADSPNEMPVATFLEGYQAVLDGELDQADQWKAEYQKNLPYKALRREDHRDSGPTPTVSVVIVAYNTKQDLITCIESLEKQQDQDFEVLVVDNGGNDDVWDQLRTKKLLHIINPANLILSEGRNIGAFFARGQILAMLDDDAVVPSNYIASIKQAFATYDIDALRGRISPKSDSPNNRHAQHYDFGPVPFPSPIDTEGNSAWRADVYREMGGMNPLLFGHEGTELSFRIAAARGAERLIYWPETVILHDYAVTDTKLGEKSRRHQAMKEYLHHLHPEIEQFIAVMRQPLYKQGGREAASQLIPRIEGKRLQASSGNPDLIRRSNRMTPDHTERKQQVLR
ncbi:glycosyltransferase [bacterium]|nr:glycosyltransferase [bacterium]